MSTMMEILRDLTPLNRVFCSDDYDKSIDYLKKILPFKVLGFPASEEYNGWVIPPHWNVKEAKIFKNGTLIYDGMQHALSVIALSNSFQGKIDLEELKKHLWYDHRYPDAIPFRFRQQYRSWDRDWGFCVPKSLFDRLEPGSYEVVLQTEEREGKLKILEFDKAGKLGETFVFVAHLDHPGMANDDLAGCAVGVELFRRLSSRNTKYSYKLLLLQEIMGSEYFLGKSGSDGKRKPFEALMLEMLGTETPLALQRSLNESSNFEWALLKSLQDLKIPHRTGPFRSIVGNDEIIWEGYGIPMASLTRYPYPEYHCSRDNLSIISERALNESVEVLLKAVDCLESSHLVRKKFQGNLCLSHPKYDLYVDAGQPAFGTEASPETKKMRLLMDLIPTLRGPVTVKSLSEKVGLSESAVTDYLGKWAKKGLLEIQ